MESSRFLMDVWSENVAPGDYVFISTKRGHRWKDYPLKFHPKKTILQVEELLDRNEDSNVYFCPNGFSDRYRKKGYAIPTIYAWADLDDADPHKCRPRPDIAWETSPKRYAALWIGKRRHREAAENLSRQHAYDNGADRSGWDYPQVLRVPGTRNHKYRSKPLVKLLWYGKQEEFTGELRKLLNARGVTPGDRSTVLYKLVRMLQERGKNSDQILKVLVDTPWNKFSSEKRLKEDVDRILSKTTRTVTKRELPKEVNGVESPFVSLADVSPMGVKWLWYPYLAKGHFSIIEGNPGIGKSTLIHAIASAISARKRLPGQGKAVEGKVLIMSNEDPIPEVTRPHIDAMGGNPANIRGGPVQAINEEGLEVLDHELRSFRPKLVIIDPLMSAMDDVDSNSNSEVRRFADQLAELARTYNTTILGVRHLTKGGRDQAIFRGLGAISLLGAARTVLQLGQDNEDESLRLMAHIKSNIGPHGPSVGFSIDPKFKWRGVVKRGVYDLVKTDDEMKKLHVKRDEIESALKNELKKPRRTSDVYRAMEARGYNVARSIRKAREAIGVVAVKKGGEWWWTLPTE